MPFTPMTPKLLASLIAAACLSACGGGGGNDTAAQTAVARTPNALTTSGVSASALAAPGAPQATGNTATDGLNWFNFRRSQLGEPVLARTATIDTAAQGHSRYQGLNDVITHEQVQGNTGFTGVAVYDRLTAAKYVFTNSSYAYGEVISSTIDQSGFNAAEELITAIYHRFAVFEPMFRQAGAGGAVSSSGRTYFTVDFTSDGLSPALGRGKFVTYPIDKQTDLPTVFFSDFESPDPVPNQNAVGYPISVHADITSSVVVQSFTVRPRNGAVLQTRLLENKTDPETPASAAAIVPLATLVSGTTYDVQFTGTVDGAAVSRAWSFSTR